MELLDAARDLVAELRRTKFAAPVNCVYNPLEYAWERYEEYLLRYARAGVPTIMLGMNPGPFGMAQTGVPFGDVAMVRDWLGIHGPVGKPPCEHPKRPVTGYDCHRSEVSGQRVWGWARERYGRPQAFFEKFFIANYCPLCFMEDSGRNRTPDKLAPAEREALYGACNRHLRRTVEYLKPRHVVGIGQFAATRAREALEGLSVETGGSIHVDQILHPSPASPLANAGWAAQAEKQLQEMGIQL